MTNDNAEPDRLAELRKQAEAQLAREAQDILDMSPDEARKLVHELRTHQIELEMQNEEFRCAQEELIESRDRYSDLYDFAPVGYATVSHKGLILEANLTLADMLGVDRGSLVKQRLSAFIVPDDEDVLYLHRMEILKTKERHTCRLRMLRKGAEPLWAEMDSILIDDDDASDMQFRTAIIDITQRRHLEEQLRHAHKMEAIGQLAAGVAHEFNNLLVGILGSAQALLAVSEEELSEYYRQPLKNIEKSGRRAARLTRQLLAFARKKNSELSVFDLNRVVGDAETMLQRTLGERITMEMGLASDLPPVRADEEEIEQAILNLATNARDAMPEGGTLTIRTTPLTLDKDRAAENPHAHPGPYVLLSVTDTGCGMSPETVQRIFEPFFSTKPVGKGTGLGLSTVFADVTKNDGFVTVDSRLGRGTVFNIYLPAAEGEVRAASCDTERPAETCSGGGETILVCDDEEVVLDSVAFLLESRGYKIICANGGRQALEAAASHAGTIPLLITDVIMPKMNGWELAEKLAKEHPDTKVIFMSGYAEDVFEAGAIKGEHVAFLQKPAEGDELLQRIREVLDTSPTRQRG